MNIKVIGASTTKFGELWDVSSFTLAKLAIDGALKDAGIKPFEIDALFVGNMLSCALGNQANYGSFIAGALGIYVPSTKIEAACASGGLALHNAINSVLAGAYQTVLVVGIEKMTDATQEEVTKALMGAGSDEERLSGITFPGIYALMAREYMQTYSVTEEDLAVVSVKNHYHGTLNENAQFQYPITVKDVLQSTKIADPLKLLECSPVSDGAAAIIITSDTNRVKKSKQVSIIASEVATDTLSLTKRKSLTTLQAVVNASENAYKKTKLSPLDIDVAEIHDCFSIAEVIATEDLGFAKRGKAAQDIKSGKMTIGGMHKSVVTNPSGGLKSCGHPVGATGIKQIVEIVHQLRGQCGRRQVPNAHIGLTHNVGGSGAISVIHILKNN